MNIDWWEALISAIIAALSAGGMTTEPISRPVIETRPPIVEPAPDVNDDWVVVGSDPGEPPVESLGWIDSPYTGKRVCVTAAPCEDDPQWCGPECSSFNWVTNEAN